MGFIKKNEQKKEETDSTEKKEYLFSEDAELKACRYCQTMIPKTARICPNCRKRLKKNWLGFFLCICLLAACAAGFCYYVTVYSVTKSVIGNVEVVQSEEAVQDVAADVVLEEGQMTENGTAAMNEAMEDNTAGLDGAGMEAALQTENLPEISTEFEAPADFELEEIDGLAAGIEMEDESEKVSESKDDNESEKASESEKGGELGNESELEKNGEPESGSEDEKADESGEDVETITERGVESEDVAEEEERAGMMADAEAGDESDTEPENDTDLPDGTVKITDISMYTEEEFRDICERVDYKKLLRRQELYLDAAVTEEMTVMEQVDGGLFDENIYYLCKREDEQGITRYYIIRDDRDESAAPILEGDVLRVYGQLFGSCKLPGYLLRTQPVVPALTMVYYDILAE
ncbi:MAG: hypothetical protein HFI50_04450 [Lachnospiraceae bacterium]|nr:hypothetical protein [Lachnospiraceae bacterium]